MPCTVPVFSLTLRYHLLSMKRIQIFITFICVVINGVFPFIGSPSKSRCAPGYHGFICTDRCRYPWYGVGCKSTCQCSQHICDHVIGCTHLPDECPSGYTGSYCGTQCRFPHYGKGCQQVCTCSKQRCNISTGCYFEQTSQKSVQRTAKNYVSTAFHPTTALYNRGLKNDSSMEPINYGNNRHNNDLEEVTSLEPNGTTVMFTGEVHDESGINHSYFGIKITWIRIIFIILGVALIKLILMHIAMSLLRTVLEKRKKKETEGQSHDI